MLYGLIGRTTSANTLKDALDVSVQRTRAIAGRVSQASLGGDGFALPTQAPGVEPATDAVDVEAEMARLADEQLHFEATAKLLEKTYARLRSSIRER
jgi:flagellar basal body rod protein FlgB